MVCCKDPPGLSLRRRRRLRLSAWVSAAAQRARLARGRTTEQAGYESAPPQRFTPARPALRMEADIGAAGQIAHPEPGARSGIRGFPDPADPIHAAPAQLWRSSRPGARGVIVFAGNAHPVLRIGRADRHVDAVDRRDRPAFQSLQAFEHRDQQGFYRQLLISLGRASSRERRPGA